MFFFLFKRSSGIRTREEKSHSPKKNPEDFQKAAEVLLKTTLKIKVWLLQNKSTAANKRSSFQETWTGL